MILVDRILLVLDLVLLLYITQFLIFIIYFLLFEILFKAYKLLNKILVWFNFRPNFFKILVSLDKSPLESIHQISNDNRGTP
jgi:hypothetical protein